MTMTIVPVDHAVQKKFVDVKPLPDATMDVSKMLKNRRALKAISLGAKQALQRGR